MAGPDCEKCEGEKTRLDRNHFAELLLQDFIILLLYSKLRPESFVFKGSLNKGQRCGQPNAAKPAGEISSWTTGEMPLLRMAIDIDAVLLVEVVGYSFVDQQAGHFTRVAANLLAWYNSIQFRSWRSWLFSVVKIMPYLEIWEHCR
jgi:hypothetical protein